MIRVYCDDESTRSGVHKGRTVRVLAFGCFRGEWHAIRPARGRSQSWERLEAAQVPRLPKDEDTVYLMQCKLCRRSLQRRADVIDPALDTLAAHGMESVSLTALAARVE